MSEDRNKPVVTVITPCHNQIDYIGRAIHSVLKQDYENKQMVILDCGDDDSGDFIINEFFDNPTIHAKAEQGGTIDEGTSEGMPLWVLKHKPEPTGPSASRNHIIKFIWDQTHVFMTLDDDDYYYPSKMSKCVAKFVEAPNHIGLVYNDLDIQHIDDGRVIREYRQPYNRLVLERENIISNTPLINKEALAKVGLYDVDLRTCEDWDLWLRITEHFVAVHIPEALSSYTVTGENATFTVPDEQWQRNWTRVQEKLAGRHGQQRQ